ncbi:hypothetical protein Btru_028810, partial [Bulinus truncatus]
MQLEGPEIQYYMGTFLSYGLFEALFLLLPSLLSLHQDRRCSDSSGPWIHQGGSVSMNMLPNVKYQPLSQTTLSDDEDEGYGDNILYDSRLVNGPKMDRRNVFELEKLGQPRIRSPPNGPYLGSGRKTVVIIAVLLVIVLGVVAAVVFPIINHLFNHGVVIDIMQGQKSDDWKRVFNNTWTESSVRITDVNQDKLDDVIVSLADKYLIDLAMNRDTDLSMAHFCELKGLMYPCGGTLLALRGYDGKDLWKTSTRSIVLDTFCGDIDVNKDGVGDCINTGRQATCQATDTKLGKILWVVDPERREWSNHFMPLWSVYRGPTVPDLDNDGVLDFIILHSRDGHSEFWEHETTTRARLIILSGKTGLPIGKGYFDLPTKTESYMPPVKHVTSTGAIYILFGTGSQKTPGHLMAISLPDLYQNITGQRLPHVEISKYHWLKNLQIENGITKLFSGNSKGVMVPPILVDVQKDGIVDILVITVEGSVALLNGDTFTCTWTKTFTNVETNSSPTPGHYNFDEILDFLILLNEEDNGSYNFSKSVILSGMDGTELWSYNASRVLNSSDLSLRTSQSNHDFFLIKLSARNTSHGMVKVNEYFVDVERTGNEQNFSKTDDFRTMCEDIRQRVSKDHVMCDNDLEFLKQEIVLFDHVTAYKPLKILEENAFNLHYTLHHKPGEPHCHDLTKRQKDKIQMCTVLEPTSYP